MAVSLDNNTLVTGHDNGFLRVWDLPDPQKLHTKPLEDMKKPLVEYALSKYGISSISFSSKDQSKVLVNMMDSQVQIFDLKLGAL